MEPPFWILGISLACASAMTILVALQRSNLATTAGLLAATGMAVYAALAATSGQPVPAAMFAVAALGCATTAILINFPLYTRIYRLIHRGPTHE